MENICCICLREKLKLFRIFEQTQAADGNTIAEILEKYAHYKVQPEDELPHQICGECKEEVHSAYYFMKKAESAYHRIMHMLGKDTISAQDDCYEQESIENHGAECGEKNFIDSSSEVSRLDLDIKRSSIKEKDCYVCGKTFPDSRQLRGHLALEHPCEGLSKDMQCPICYRQFSRKDHMKRHLKNVHKQDVPGYISKRLSREMKNAVTDETTHDISTLRDPMSENSNMSDLMQDNTIKTHEQENMDTKSKLVNNECDDNEANIIDACSTSKLPPSKKSRSHNILFPCQICQRKFTHKHNLKRHLKNVHKQFIPTRGVFGIRDEVEIDLNERTAAVEVNNISTTYDEDEDSEMTETILPVCTTQLYEVPRSQDKKCNLLPNILNQQQKAIELRKYQCHICRRLFKRRDHVRRHVYLVHKQDMIGKSVIAVKPQTSLPERTFIEPTYIQRTPAVNRKRHKQQNEIHAKIESDEMGDTLPPIDPQYLNLNPELQCQLCMRYFTRKDNLRRHLHKVHEQDDSKYDRQDDDDDDDTILKETIVDDTLNYNNDYKTFNSELMPMKPEELPNDKQCPICERIFSNKQHMKRHLINVHKDIINSNGFNIEEYFNSLKVAKNISFENHCPICQRHFVRKSHVRRHVYTVHKEALPETCMDDDMVMNFEAHEMNDSMNQNSTHWMNYENSTNFGVYNSETITHSAIGHGAAFMKNAYYDLSIEPELQIKVEPKDDFSYD